MASKPRKKRRHICRNGACVETRLNYNAAVDRISEMEGEHKARMDALSTKLAKAIDNNDTLTAELKNRKYKSDLEVLLDRSFKELEGLIEMKRFHEALP